MRSQLTLLQKLEFIMEMKGFCINVNLMVSSKYNMMVVAMVRMMISNTPHLKSDPKDYLYSGKIAKMSV